MASSFKILALVVILPIVDKLLVLVCAKRNLVEEGYCELIPRCVCVKASRSSNFFCENEINVRISSGVYPHPVRFTTFIIVVCNPDIPSHMLKHNYYDLLQLQSYPPEINSLYVDSCPVPPESYIVFTSRTLTPKPSSLNTLNDSVGTPEVLSNITINKLTIDCKNFTKQFVLKRKHLLGLSSLRVLNITCHTLFEIHPDLFYDTTPLLGVLTIFSTQLSFIPNKGFSTLSRLRELSLNKNLLSTLLNDTFFGLKSLGRLDLSDNNLILLEDDIFNAINDLRFLNLSKNHLSLLPKSISSLSNLTVLDVSYNSLERINELEGLYRLERLYLMNNNLKYLNPASISSLKNLERIDVSRNSITNLSGIFILDKLYSFRLSDNAQPKFSIEPFLQSNNLEDLIMSNSSIVSLHPELLQNLPRIKRVDFNNNNIDFIPDDFFSKSPHIYYIGLEGNRISDLQANTFVGNPNLQEIHISSNKINILPDSLFNNNSELNILDLSRNMLTVLPDNLFYHQINLHHLDVSENKLHTIHSELLNRNIEIYYLDLSGNMLDSLPKEIFMPFNDSLVTLNLGRNHIYSLPSLQLPRLKYLNLSDNNLESLPEGVFHKMPNLEILILSNNHLKNLSNSPLLPEGLEMSSLDLSQNHLSYIPEKIFKAKNLRITSIDFSGNLMESFYMDRIGDVKDLIKLHVANNNLSYFGIEPGVDFWDLFPSVKLLDLSNNKLDFKEAGWFFDNVKQTWGKVTPLLWFVNVEVFLLSNNSISRMFLDWRDDLHSLRLLDLRYNKIQQLRHQDLLFTSPNAPHAAPVRNTLPKTYVHPRIENTDPPPAPPASLIVDVRGNNITTVDIPFSKVVPISLTKNGTVPEGVYGHTTILLDENPFVCDCKLMNFMRVLQNDVAPISELKKSSGKDWVMPAKLDVGNLSCWKPLSVRGKMLSEPETWIHHLLPMLSLCSLLPG